MKNISRKSISRILGISIVIILLISIGVIIWYSMSRSPQEISGTTTSRIATTSTSIQHETLTQTQISLTNTITTQLPRTYIPATLNGGGSSAINPQMQNWAKIFRDDISEGAITVNYQSIGSGAGQKGIVDGSLDFAGSDIPLTKDNYDALKSKGRGFIQIPIIAISIAVIYNIPEWDQSKCGPLRLSPEAIAEIYLGNIVYWDDPLIKNLQKPECQALLPHKEIYGVHRSDGSGSTALLTMYLSKAYPKWNQTVGYGLVVNWPIDNTGRGIGGKGSEGVIAQVKNTKYSIGYVEPNYAEKENIPIAAVTNKAGQFILPTKDAIEEALKRGATALPKPDEYWGSVPLQFVYQDGNNTYPIVGTPIIIIRTDLPKDKLEALKQFFTWVLTNGQKETYVLPGYYPLPTELTSIAVKYLSDYLK
ncbi:MAG: phosphate ABC transporter substrate-binding protein PstS [Sulfolobales archaeon]